MKTTAFIVAALPLLAVADVRPVKTYYGVGRPFPVKVSGDELRLLEAVSAKVLRKAPTKSGTVDVAEVLSLWEQPLKNVVYLQAFKGNKPHGPALVLQPMTNPTISTLASDGRSVAFSPDEDSAFAGYRAWVDQDALFDTDLGSIRVRMRPDAAPNTVWNFLELVKGGFYENVIFHRVVAKRPDGHPFVIQGGDPTGTGMGSPGYAFPLENSSLPHDFGVISMARSTDPNTNGSQFFFCLSKAGTQMLDHRYASFGQTLSGAETIFKIAAVPCGAEDRPNKPPVIRSIRLVPAAPYGTGPEPEGAPTPS